MMLMEKGVMKQPSIHNCDDFIYDGNIKYNTRTGRGRCKNGALEINTRGIGKIAPTDMGPSHFQTDTCTKGASDRGHSMDKVFSHVLIAMIPVILAHMKGNFPMVGFMGKVKPHF